MTPTAYDSQQPSTINGTILWQGDDSAQVCFCSCYILNEVVELELWYRSILKNPTVVSVSGCYKFWTFIVNTSTVAELINKGIMTYADTENVDH